MHKVKLECGLLAFFACLLASIAGDTLAQDTVAQRAAPRTEDRIADPVYMSWVSQRKVADCIRCHAQGLSEAQILGGNATALTSFSRRTEMEQWLTQDKHTIARRRIEPYRVQDEGAELQAMLDGLVAQQTKAIEDLNRIRGTSIELNYVLPSRLPEDWVGEGNILSRRICDKLWGIGAVTRPEGYALFRENCLTCHGGYRSGDPGFTLASKSREQIGIDCLYCHDNGASEQWIQRHQSPENWRLLTPEQKSADGMRHLVGTSNQAQLCFDCHIGNRSRNMFVSHEMYAAGHPPLPSIELQKFCEEMPQHWQTPSQLHESLVDYAGREDYFRKNYPGVLERVSAGSTFWNTRKMLVGALSARRQSLDLLIDSANPHRWADYSLYDCAACHHELRVDSRRQLRGFPGQPGRPRQHEWPETILTIAYRFYGGGGQRGREVWANVRALESRLAEQFSAKPFGDPGEVKTAAEELREKVVEAIHLVESSTVDARIANGVLLGLSRTPKEKLLTYDAARQVVWAMQTIVDELDSEGFPVEPRIVEIVKSLGDPDVTGIESRIPAGRKSYIFPNGLATDLRFRASFQPDRLKSLLNQISEAMN